MNEFENLKGMIQLQNLRVDSNPVTSFPNFRKHLILMLPQLKQIDGVNIEKQERREAEIVTSKQRGLL